MNSSNKTPIIDIFRWLFTAAIIALIFYLFINLYISSTSEFGGVVVEKWARESQTVGKSGIHKFTSYFLKIKDQNDKNHILPITRATYERLHKGERVEKTEEGIFSLENLILDPSVPRVGPRQAIDPQSQ